ncbi:MAG: hypothetical protein AAFW95_13135 [Cyanobacteria bacterium J06638_6]
MTIPQLSPSKYWLVLILLACIGCRAVLPPGVAPVPETTTLMIEAKALGEGEFNLSGTTNLPDNTQLTAVALRYLESETSIVSARSADDVLYSVLDYQPVTVANGQWTTQLNLWQVAADGRYQEPWQAQAEALNLAAQPKDTVQFAITLAPSHFGKAMGDVLAQVGRPRVAGILRLTTSGEPFLWADRSLPVGLPQGQTTPPDELLTRTNGGWGKRYLLVPEPLLPYTLTPEDERQTTAPATLDEWLR